MVSPLIPKRTFDSTREESLLLAHNERKPQASLRSLRLFAFLLTIVAGALYSLHLWRSLCSSEAYTALAASQPDYAGVIHMGLRFDPGKPPLYQLLLHPLVLLLGNSEPVLRAPSVFFSMLTVATVFALGSEMFQPEVGIAAAILWAISPLAVLYGGWARNYAMLVALSMGQFVLLWSLRCRPRLWGTLACGVLGAAILYTHLGGSLFLGAEAAMLIGACWRGERGRAPLISLLIAFTLFLPFVPIATAQVHELVVGHWVDWIGFAHATPPLKRVAAALVAGVCVAALVFAPRIETAEYEPMRWCAGVGLIPIIALAAGSAVLRPMFAIRYVSPSIAVLVVLLSGGLAALGALTFRLATFGIGAFLFFLLPYYNWYNPWRDIARIVASAPPEQTVFFEPSFTDTEIGLDSRQGFPQGFLRVAFDHYYSGSNPRRVIDPSKPAQARRIIAEAAASANGAWLVTIFDDQQARAEMPSGCFRIEPEIQQLYASLYHVVPTAACKGQDHR